MPYRKKSVTTKIANQKPTAQNQKKQLATLSRQITTLKSAVKKPYIYQNFKFDATNQTLGQATGGTSEVDYRLISPSAWSTVWQDADPTPEVSSFDLLNFKINWSITNGTSSGPNNYSVYLLSPKKESAQDVLDTTTYGSIWTPDVHYRSIVGQGNTKWLINPQSWKVHYQNHFQIRKYANDLQTVQENDSKYYRRQGVIYVRPRMTVKDPANNAFANSYTGVNDKDQYIFVVFTDADTNLGASKLDMFTTLTVRHT